MSEFWRFRHVTIALFVFLLPFGCGPAPRPVKEISATTKSVGSAPPIAVAEDDWPWWRGPNRNNVANCVVAPTTWSDSHNVIWKTPVSGRGHGSPTVVGDQIFLCTAHEGQQQQLVVCFHRTTGQQQWETVVHSGGFPGSGGMHGKSTHANGTLACDGTTLFVAFLNAEHVVATGLSLEGKIKWQTNLGFFVPKFGYAPSPCLHESLVIFSGDNRGGGFLAALHRDTGDIVWRKARNNTDTYSSAMTIDIEGRTQLIISGDDRVASYDPLTGDEIWTCPGTAQATCGTVVSMGHLVYASGGYPARQTICIDARTGRKVWEDQAKCYEQSMLIADNHLFAVTDDGIAMCWEAETGKQMWKHRLRGPISASPVLVGSLIYATSELGTTWVFEANASEFRQVAKNQLGSAAFATPAICGEQIFARVAAGNGQDRQEHLYCLGEQSDLGD